MPVPNAEALIDTAIGLALEIARLCPESADRAQRLVAIVSELRAVPLDRGAVADAIESGTADSDLSDAQVRTATEAVLRSARDDDR